MVFEQWLSLPLTVRLVLLGISGAWVGAFVNWAAAHLSFFGSRMTPWSVPSGQGQRLLWWEKLPVLGWICLKRRGHLTGTWSWLRPVMIECATSLGLPALYWWECVERGLLPPELNLADIPHASSMLHVQFVAHAVLFTLLLAATLIDFDEKTIPDTITVPGTLFGIWWMAFQPWALLPHVTWQENTPRCEPLWAWPVPWGTDVSGLRGLLLAWLILLIWGWGLLDKTCTLRRGWYRGLIYVLASAYRRQSWRIVGPVVLVAGAGCTWAWWRQGEFWQAALSSVFGLALGGGVIWAVRIIGHWALRVEAMGFGDVTLMAMIGSTLGWQASLIVFFLAPLAGLVIALVQFLLRGTHVIAFGPYLSLAAVCVVVGWDTLWRQRAQEYFVVPQLTLTLLGVGLLLLGLFLWLWRLVRQQLFALEQP